MNEIDFVVSAVAKHFEGIFRQKLGEKTVELLDAIAEAARNESVEEVLELSEALRVNVRSDRAMAVNSEARHWAERFKRAIDAGSLRDELDELRREDDRMDVEPLLYRDFPRLIGAILEAEGSYFREGIAPPDDDESEA